MNYDHELAPWLTRVSNVDLGDIELARTEMERHRLEMMGTVALRNVTWTDSEIAAPTADHLQVRRYEPAARVVDQMSPALLFFHGGGFVMGSIESEHVAAGVLAVSLGVPVVSVEYRLAPEHPYPAALDDACTAFAWLHAEAMALNIDPTRIALVGNSAGGGLAAALAIRLRDEGALMPCFQYLGIPELDDRLQTVSSRSFVDTPLWNRPSAELSWRYYIGEPGDAKVPITCAPGRATAADLVGLPPTYISAMEYDPLRDEDVNYAMRLLEAGVSVELHVFPGTFHGSSQLSAEVSKRDRREMTTVLRRALGLPAK